MQAIAQKDFVVIDDSLDGLIGLGDGFAPAVDYVLTGLIATVRYSKEHLVCGADYVNMLA